MASDIHLSVSTAYGDGFESYVDYVRLPTPFGSLGVLRGHCDMLCAVSPGLVRYSVQGERGSLEVGEGVATVSNNEVILLVSSIKHE